MIFLPFWWSETAKDSFKNGPKSPKYISRLRCIVTLQIRLEIRVEFDNMVKNTCLRLQMPKNGLKSTKSTKIYNRRL